MKKLTLPNVLFFLMLFWIAPAWAQPKTGQAKLDSLERALRNAPQDTAWVNTLLQLANHSRTISPSKSVAWGQKAAEAARTVAWSKGLAKAYNHIGNAYCMAGRLDSAQSYYTHALAINREDGNMRQQAQNLGNLGNVSYMLSDNPKALDYLLQALKVFEALKDSQGINIQLGNIANIYEKQHTYAKALSYNQLALNLRRKLGDLGGVSQSLGNIGNAYKDLGNIDLALRYDLEGLALAHKIGDKDGQGRILSNLALIHQDKKQWALAFSEMEQAFQGFKVQENPAGMGVNRSNQAALLLALAKSNIAAPIPNVPNDRAGRLKMAYAYVQQAVNMQKQVKGLEELSFFYRIRSEIEEAMGNSTAALASFKLFKTYTDSVFSTANTEKLTNLETQRAYELKDKQIELERLAVAKKRNERVFYLIGLGLLLVVIAIMFRNFRVQKRLNTSLAHEKETVELRTEALNNANTDLQAAMQNLRDTQVQLIQAEKMKENAQIRSRISQDIHDDISSELTRISWVSELARAKVGRADFADMPDLLEKITDSSRETVQKLGEIIWTVDPHNDKLEILLAHMRGYVARFLGETDLEYVVDFPDEETEMALSPELKRNLFLVMKEALHNAVKYANATCLQVSFRRHGADGFTLVIGDNGRGMDSIVRGTGNGLPNMARRMQSVGGTLNVASAPGQGTRIEASGVLF